MFPAEIATFIIDAEKETVKKENDKVCEKTTTKQKEVEQEEEEEAESNIIKCKSPKLKLENENEENNISMPQIDINDDEDITDFDDNDVIHINNNETQQLYNETNNSDSKNKKPEEQSHESLDNFGSILGEELVNSYWRHGFNMSASQLTHHANTMFPPTQNQQQQPQQQHQQARNHIPTIVPQKHISFHSHPQFSHHFSHPNSANHSHSLLTQQQQQKHLQQQHGPSSTTLLSQLVNSTFSSTTSNLRTDATAAMQQHHHHHHGHQFHHQHNHSSNIDAEKVAAKLSNHHQNESTSASTPNLSEASRLADQDHSHSTHSLNGSMSNLGISQKFYEDNNNSLCATPTSQAGMPGHPHLPSTFLPGLPFQFKDLGHFRFAEDMQLPPSMAGRLGESLIPKGDPMEAKLQEMLRYNMDKYANQALDTLHISRRVRELLSVHNIGQRLFAKYILGLSQGTVSELLSKPKPWDKLTEKGRDSYRKMHAWACDDNAVMLLKSLIPKKGK